MIAIKLKTTFKYQNLFWHIIETEKVMFIELLCHNMYIIFKFMVRPLLNYWNAVESRLLSAMVPTCQFQSWQHF